jgi:hypothetical protein
MQPTSDPESGNGADELTRTSYYEAIQASSPSPSRARSLVAIATAAVVVIAAGVLAVVLHSSDKGTPVSNAQLVKLIHSASNAMGRTPATTFRMTMTISARGHEGTISMSGASVSKTGASTFTVTGPGISEGAVALDGVAYLEVPAASISKNHHKGWLAVRTPKPTAQERQLAQSGPAGLLKALRRVDGTIENEGRDVVNGVSTTEYKFHADLLQEFGSTYKKIFGPDTIDKLRSLGFDNIPMTLWLDRQGLVHKMSMNFDVGPASIAEVVYMTPTNVIPKIKAPPASDVRLVKSLHRYGVVLRKLSKVTARGHR